MKEKNKIIYIVVSIFTLIIVITGSTYAYFALSTSSNNVVTGSTANVGLTLAVNKITPSGNTTDYLVPQLESALGTAINSPYNCIDDNHNTVCQVYKATLTNTGSATEKVKGTITFTGINNIPHLKWKLISDATTIGSNTGVQASTSSTPFVGETTLNASQSIDYYFVVWIDEIGSEQTDNGTYSGSITFTSSNGRGITSTIGEVTRFNGTIYRHNNASLTNNTSSIASVTGTKWIIKLNGEENEQLASYYFDTHADCTSFLTSVGVTEGVENNDQTFTCAEKTGTFGGVEYTTSQTEIQNDYIYYLKHTVVDDIVTESYIEFVVTPAMAQANQGMTSRTYTLRGAGATSNGSGGYNNDSPYFETNKQTLLTAFGSSNCTVYSSNVDCSVSGLNAYANADGSVNVSDDSANCDVDRGGNTSCNSL